MNKKYLQFIVLLLTLLFIASFVSAEIFEVNLIKNVQNTTTLQPVEERTIFDVNLIKTSYSQSQTNIVYVSKPVQTTSSKPPSRFGVFLGDEVLNVCSCSQYRDLIRIKNTENKNVVYTLSSNSNYVKINPSAFQLRSGDIQIVELLINAPCNELEETLKINVKLSGNGDATLTKKLSVSQCQNLDVKLKADTNTINPCNPVNYNLYVKNVGLFPEEYSVSSNYDDFMNYSAKIIKLNSSQEGVVNAVFTPSCALYGDALVNFSVSAKKNHLVANVKHNLTINKLYDYSLDVKEKNSVCEEELNPVTVMLKNNVKTPNKYYLKLVGAPDFVKLSSTNFELGPNEVKKLNLTLDPIEGKNLGFYNFTLKTSSNYGNVSKEKKISLKINDCYKPQITILEPDKTLCAQDQKISVNVKNNGLYEEKISLKTYPNPGIATFDKDFITLKPGENADVTLSLKPEDKTWTYGVLVQAVLDNGITASDETKDLKFISQWSCHKVAVDKNTYLITRETQNSAVLKITNKGLQSGKYYLTLEPKDFWIKLSEKKITLDAGETKEVLLLSNHTNKTPFGEYALNLTVQYDNSFKYKHNLVVKLKDKAIYVKVYDYLYSYFSENPCHFVTVLLILAIIILAIIAGLTKKKGWLKKRKFIVFLIVLLLILSVFLWLIYYFKGGPYLNKPIDYSNATSTHFIWAQNKVYELDRASFVFDPDNNDSVNLSLRRSSEYVNITITNDTILFTPKKGWYGTTKVSFNAIDNHGALTKSPNIILEVVKRDKYNLVGAYNKLCFYFNWILLLIAFIFVAIIGYKKIRMDFYERRANAAKKKRS